VQSVVAASRILERLRVGLHRGPLRVAAIVGTHPIDDALALCEEVARLRRVDGRGRRRFARELARPKQCADSTVAGGALQREQARDIRCGAPPAVSPRRHSGAIRSSLARF